MSFESYNSEPTPTSEDEVLEWPKIDDAEQEDQIDNLGNDVEGIEGRESVMESFQERRGNILRDTMTSEVMSNSLDLVPFVGGGKMLSESVYGKTLDGEKLSGKDRIIHGAMGAGSLALDFTMVGEASKAITFVGKSTGLIEKLSVKLGEKGAVKGAKIFKRTAQFMTDHPELTRRAEKFAEKKAREVIKDIREYRSQTA